jgi:N utilization substance protein B
VKRRAAREMALKVLFAHDLGKTEPLFILEQLSEEDALSNKGKEFVLSIVQGVVDHLEEIDNTIKKYTLEWDLDRMAAVDRNLLRIALFEMLYLESIPKVVAVNEAIELAKLYGSEESFRFVNGILGNAIQEISK